ncbi:MAG: DUF1501 domain-containing protein [Bacteroidota bacterium]
MCDTHTHTHPSHHPHRSGRRLEEGDAHSADHARWTRRRFLGALSLAGLGGTLLGGSHATTLMASNSVRPIHIPNGDRILVLIQLEGGNDGLNTVVPFRNDIYQRNRPTLAFSRNQTLELSSDLGFHPSLGPLHRRFQDGQVAVVQNVGYDESNRSHFRSTDIWVSASDANQSLSTGWAGRALEATYPNFGQNPPPEPPGVRIGGSRSMFIGDGNRMGVSFDNADVLDRLAEGGALYDQTNVPSATYGQEVAFVRGVANRSFRYAGALQQAASGGQNRVAYPEDTELGNQLASVARLIRGGLQTRVYMVSLGGFDTHVNQADDHAYLMDTLAQSIDAFMRDLEADGLDQRVLLMTFSEFGRTLAENGGLGTDHAAAAPLFLIGRGVQGGIVGGLPDLANLDPFGDLRHTFDYRQVYASILNGWFGLSAADTQTVLGRSYTTIPVLPGLTTGTSTAPSDTPRSPTGLQAPYPNPARSRTTVPFTLASPSRVRLGVFDVTGRPVRSIFEGMRGTGTHTVPLDLSGLAAGLYLVRLQTPQRQYATRLVVVR